MNFFKFLCDPLKIIRGKFSHVSRQNRENLSTLSTPEFGVAT